MPHASQLIGTDLRFLVIAMAIGLMALEYGISRLAGDDSGRDAALGLLGGANWAPDLDTPQNRRFVAGYEKAYDAVPATYAFQAYDAALLIDAALRRTLGDTSDKNALRAAMMKADFASLRGKFRFNTNHYPIQDFYLTKVARRADGRYQTEIVQKVFSDMADPYAKDCKMR